jgi:hypothetical protein
MYNMSFCRYCGDLVYGTDIPVPSRWRSSELLDMIPMLRETMEYLGRHVRGEV